MATVRGALEHQSLQHVDIWPLFDFLFVLAEVLETTTQSGACKIPLHLPARFATS